MQQVVHAVAALTLDKVQHVLGRGDVKGRGVLVGEGVVGME